jgi:chloride channel protein, CIC family
MKWIKTLYQLFADHLRAKMNKAQYVLYVASLVGLASGLIAVLLKKLVHYLQHWIEEIPAGPTYLLFPLLGLVATVFVIKRFFGGAIERGIAMVLRSIAKRSSVIPFSHTYSHLLTSSITVGFGGSVGLESPIVATGSAVGSNIARINTLGYRERSLLIACGAAAGIAAVFNAPIAGIIFAIEVLLVETVVSYFIPLIISAVIGTLCSKIILEESILFNFALQQHFDYTNVPFYLLLGVLCGFVALYYARSFKYTEHRIHQWNINRYWKAVVGGLLLMIMYSLFPPLFGEGYNSVKLVANGEIHRITDKAYFFTRWQDSWGLLVFAVSIVLLKPIAAAITIGSGGNGGNFAPSLFAGAYLGFSFSRLINSSSFMQIPESNFSLVGMAGILSGVMYCPLTAIFLIAEITNGYELFIPLMIVSSVSYFIVKHYERFSMETKALAISGEILMHNKEQQILNSIDINEMLQDERQTIEGNLPVVELVNLFAESEINVYAVHDSKNVFTGIVDLQDVKKILLNLERVSELCILELSKQPEDVIYIYESMAVVMEKFGRSNSWFLPVLDAQNEFVGFISRSKLFNKYRQVLAAKTDLYD